MQRCSLGEQRSHNVTHPSFARIFNLLLFTFDLFQQMFVAERDRATTVGDDVPFDEIGRIVVLMVDERASVQISQQFHHHTEHVVVVDQRGVTQRGVPVTRWQLLPELVVLRSRIVVLLRVNRRLFDRHDMI